MSRHEYTDDVDNNWSMIMWRGAVISATRGKRGQNLLKDIAKAMDEMPVKELVAESLICSDGVCALGAAGKMRGLDMSIIDPEDYGNVAKLFGVAPSLIREITYKNDERGVDNPELRWKRMRDWVESQIRRSPCHE